MFSVKVIKKIEAIYLYLPPLLCSFGTTLALSLTEASFSTVPRNFVNIFVARMKKAKRTSSFSTLLLVLYGIFGWKGMIESSITMRRQLRILGKNIKALSRLWTSKSRLFSNFTASSIALNLHAFV